MNKIILNDMIEKVSGEFHNILKDSMLDSSLTKDEYEQKNKEKIKLQLAIKECIFQNNEAKQMVKNKIREIIEEKYSLNDFNIDEVINFNKMEEVESDIKFSILLNFFKNKKVNVFEEGFEIENIIKKYGLDELKEDNLEERYVITKDDVDYMIKDLKIKLDYEEKMFILVQYIYSRYKGYGVIDELLEQKIDGINGGVSGFENDLNESFLNCIWMIYKGKNIHLKFLKFENIEELKRICLNIYKYDSPGELSRNVGYKINKMKDGSRVVVLRPSFSEEWMFFIRKFHASNLELKELINAKNKENVIKLMEFITKGCNNICVSGQQGSGKTTMLLNLIGFLYPVYPIRILESSFELNVRKKFPNRNICTIQETDDISGQTGLDLLKKTDGLINIIGEVASDDVAAQLIQSGKVAAKATLFTHHAKSTEELIKSLRNSLLKTGMFRNEKIAEEEVASIINFDIHLEKDFYGNRYIERINECVFEPRTGTYKIANLIEYKNNEYIVNNSLTQEMIKKIEKELKKDDKIRFEEFINDINQELSMRIKNET